MDDVFLSKRIFTGDEFFNGAIIVSPDGKIKSVLRSRNEIDLWFSENQPNRILDYDNYVIMPGLVDSHVHINEPGRTEWEGFVTATKAAAAGGFTTIVDMPLNSIPPTTTVKNLEAKKHAAVGKLFVDLAFWGGVVPGNENELNAMIEEGVVGFKCFLCPSGVPEFSSVNADEVELALSKLHGTDAVLAFHAEMCPHNHDDSPNDCEPKKYDSYLKTRPATMELEAIKMVGKLSIKYDVRTHIVHLCAAEAIPYIKICRGNGAKITVETCHHYLNLCAEQIPDEQTEFKCSPPIRNRSNRELLWEGIVNGHIDLVVSDHSPSTPTAKLLTVGKDRGNFLKAWGGISSVQFGLPLFWTKCQEYGLGIKDVVRLMSTAPANLCGIEDRKGRIAIGYDADFCVWDPEAEFTITPEIIQFQNKANPYMGHTLKGVVHATILRGNSIYTNNEHYSEPLGKFVAKDPLRRLRDLD